jgi:hypothetical protein
MLISNMVLIDINFFLHSWAYYNFKSHGLYIETSPYTSLRVSPYISDTALFRSNFFLDFVTIVFSFFYLTNIVQS